MEKLISFIRAVHQARILLRDNLIYELETDSFITTETQDIKDNLMELEKWLRVLVDPETGG